MIIDMHTHAWPQKVSSSARQNLEALFKVKLVGEPTLETLGSYMDKNGISVSALAAVATKAEQVPSINDWLMGVRSQRIKVFCALHPDYPLWRQELERMQGKIDGIKLQPEFQDFYVDEERLNPLYGLMQEMQLPLLLHCGEELSGTMLVRSSPARLVKVRERFPRLKIIAAHFGGFRLWKEAEEFLLGKDVYLDTSFFFSFLPREEVRRLILSHREDRLLFGTDFPLIDQKQDIDFLNTLDVPGGLRERIFSLNARELLEI